MTDEKQLASGQDVSFQEKLDVVDETGSDRSTEEHPDIARYSEAERKKILRHIDWRILPIVGLIYTISLMDRTNCEYLYHNIQILVQLTRVMCSGKC